MQNLQFLSTELQSSIADLRAHGMPDADLDLLIDRILKASEARTTSLQLDIERIETAFERRYGLLEGKLIADNQTRTSDIYQLVSEVRNAQLAAHPQIARLEIALLAGRDYDASEFARLETKIDSAIERVDGALRTISNELAVLDTRVVVIEQRLETPTASG